MAEALLSSRADRGTITFGNMGTQYIDIPSQTFLRYDDAPRVVATFMAAPTLFITNVYQTSIGLTCIFVFQDQSKLIGATRYPWGDSSSETSSGYAYMRLSGKNIEYTLSNPNLGNSPDAYTVVSNYPALAFIPRA